MKRRRPCANRPWRIDAPRRHWADDHYTSIWTNCQDDGLRTMGCHKSSRARFLPCQGWIRVLGTDAIGVRILLMRGQATLEEVEDRGGPALFPTFVAMLRANKIQIPKRNKMIQEE